MSLHGGCHIDNSHHETSYGNYINRGYHASGQGIININHLHPDPLLELQRHCSPSAAFDSATRFDPPRCAESTRTRIIQMIEEWANSDKGTAIPSSVFWLHGGAGVGKSALAQSLSEKFQEKKQLASSFFFLRSDPTRNDGGLLIPTLVSHLIRTFKGIGTFVEDGIRENPAVFTKRCETQIQELLVEPLLALKSTGTILPQLIVIDGLDESENTDAQCELLRAIARSIPRIPYPLRFLITSRPEAHITHLFSRDPDLQAITVHEYNLSDDPDADGDIRKFLEKEFAEIRQGHRIGRRLPDDWPDENTTTSLVERSSGHFIYASTVIRYIRSPKHRPDKRLEIILCLRPPQEGDRPFAQLDALYTFIFQGVENHSQLEKICLVLGILYFECRRAGFFSEVILECTAIEKLLKMEPGDLILLLDPVVSVISVDSDEVRILHKSLFDYLLDFTRGGQLPFDLAQVHGLAATYILKQRIMEDVCSVRDFEHFAYHCQYAFLNDTLKDYLHSLEIPYPKSLTTVIKKLSPEDLNFFLQSSLWFFFRTLSREDFDSTGQASEQYAAKWMSYLHSATSGPGPTEPIRATVAKVGLWLKRKLDKPLPELNVMDDLKRQLDTLLIEWKSPKFNSTDTGMDPVRRVALIKQVHRIQSDSAKATFCGNRTIVSSLILGDYFIHGYHFGISNEASRSFLILHSYSKHGNTSYGCMHMGSVGDIAEKTRCYLMAVEKYLFSDLCQKYGLEPDADTFIRYLQSFYSQGSEAFDKSRRTQNHYIDNSETSYKKYIHRCYHASGDQASGLVDSPTIPQESVISSETSSVPLSNPEPDTQSFDYAAVRIPDAEEQALLNPESNVESGSVGIRHTSLDDSASTTINRCGTGCTCERPTKKQRGSSFIKKQTTPMNKAFKSGNGKDARTNLTSPSKASLTVDNQSINSSLVSEPEAMEHSTPVPDVSLAGAPVDKKIVSPSLVSLRSIGSIKKKFGRRGSTASNKNVISAPDHESRPGTPESLNVPSNSGQPSRVANAISSGPSLKTRSKVRKPNFTELCKNFQWSFVPEKVCFELEFTIRSFPFLSRTSVPYSIIYSACSEN